MQNELKVSLHAHEASASADSDTPLGVMAEEYAARGFDAVGFVGHSAVPDEPAANVPITILRGNEVELRTEPTRLHVLEYADQDLSILAHPGLTYPNTGPGQVIQTAMELDVDAIEAFNRGEPQVQFPDEPPQGRPAPAAERGRLVTGRSRGSTTLARERQDVSQAPPDIPAGIPRGGPPSVVSPEGFVWVAADDAHNTNQIGGSYMVVRTDRNTPQGVADAVKAGQARLRNPGLSVGSYVAGRVKQALATLESRLGG
jgi:hypothetical protein